MTKPKPSEIQGVQDEIKFWKTFVKTEQFKTWLADARTPELREDVAREVGRCKGPILDVGSGVVSILHGTVPNPQSLVTVDLLGEEYRKFFDYPSHRILPPLAMAAEDLTWEGRFSIVHMSNALDHTQNPPIAFDRLVRAVKPGGLLIIQGFVSEGSCLRGLGMHQWDLWLGNVINNQLPLSDLMLQPIGAKSGIVLSDRADLVFHYSSLDTLPPTPREWFVWMGRKK